MMEYQKTFYLNWRKSLTFQLKFFEPIGILAQPQTFILSRLVNVPKPSQSELDPQSSLKIWETLFQQFWANWWVWHRISEYNLIISICPFLLWNLVLHCLLLLTPLIVNGFAVKHQFPIQMWKRAILNILPVCLWLLILAISIAWPLMNFLRLGNRL